MNEINLLDKNTIDKIAAGEVVERPASVVKELCENAIDAGSTAVSVEIKDGGKTLIRVTDNGTGIEKDQLEKVFLRHSTSKIKSADDLSFIKTLGFRGEALSSIAAVSKLELCTKTQSSLTGSIYQINGGIKAGEKEAGLPDGTTIIVRDLFYNTPARLKFLKTAQTEASYIADIIEKTALAHPEISFKFVSNGTLKLLTAGNGSLKDTIYAVFGKYAASNLLPVDAENDILSVNGFIGKPEFSRGNRSYEIYFINNRYVKDKIVAKALEEAYKGYMMKGSFPFTVLNISIEPELIDVNVHPSKMEIRFFDNEQVYDSLYNIISGIIRKRESIPEAQEQHRTAFRPDLYKSESYEPFENKKTIIPENSDPLYAGENNIVREEFLYDGIKIPGDDDRTLNEARALNDDAAGENISVEKDFFYEEIQRPADDLKIGEQAELFEKAFLSEDARPRHRIVGEVFDTYWIVEYEEKMFIIDQHAAHEKVLYEDMLEKAGKTGISSQRIMPAVIISLSPSEEDVLARCKAQFEALGFELEHYGGKEYALTAVPADLYDLDGGKLFVSVLDELSDLTPKDSYEMITERIATASCKAAVKGGNRLSYTEAGALIDRLLKLDNPYNCPHGRPTIISMSKAELEKKFKRII